MRPIARTTLASFPIQDLPMSRLRVRCFSVSADGYGAGPDQSLENPLGVGGMALHEWTFATRTFRKMFGQEGGTTDLDDTFAVRGFENVGAWILGRNMFGPAAATGRTMAGRAGGATTRPITARSSCSRTTRDLRSRWKAARRSTSSPTASTRRWNARPRQPMARTSASAAASPPSGNTCRQDLSTRCILRFRRSCSAPANILLVGLDLAKARLSAQRIRHHAECHACRSHQARRGKLVTNERTTEKLTNRDTPRCR